MVQTHLYATYCLENVFKVMYEWFTVNIFFFFFFKLFVFILRTVGKLRNFNTSRVQCMYNFENVPVQKIITHLKNFYYPRKSIKTNASFRLKSKLYITFYSFKFIYPSCKCWPYCILWVVWCRSLYVLFNLEYCWITWKKNKIIYIFDFERNEEPIDLQWYILEPLVYMMMLYFNQLKILTLSFFIFTNTFLRKLRKKNCFLMKVYQVISKKKNTN